METLNDNIFGERLKLARKMAGVSLQELADQLNNQVSKQALNKYELGAMKPSTEVLLALSTVLKVKPDYFWQEQSVEMGEILFRKKASLLKKVEDSIVEKARNYVERFLEIENLVGVESHFENPLQNLTIQNKEDVEQASIKLRAAWQLGSEPIPNIVEMLEQRGIKIILIEDREDLDGFATITSAGIPIVLINVHDKSVERTRFTIVHELAHLLLDFTEIIKADSKQLEKLCHYFSSCFLLPRQILIRMIGSYKRTYIAIKELITIKEYCGISLRAIIHRLNELGVITQVYYEKWMVYLTKTYGAKSEPGNFKGVEKGRLFEQLINRGLSEEIISISKAAALCNSSVNEIRKGFISVR